MNSTLAIAQRELIERRFVFVAAAAFLLLALVIPFMPGVHVGERAAALLMVIDARDTASTSPPTLNGSRMDFPLNCVANFGGSTEK